MFGMYRSFWGMGIFALLSFILKLRIWGFGIF